MFLISGYNPQDSPELCVSKANLNENQIIKNGTSHRQVEKAIMEMGRTDQEVVSAGGKDEDLTPSSASRELEPSYEMEKWILPN